MKRNLLLAIFSLLMVSLTYGQVPGTGQKTVRGTVLSAEGEQLPGVNVVVKGTTFGTQTDINGDFAIDMPQGSNVLVFSYIGMERREVNVSGMDQVNVTLQSGALGLDEVVVTALGITREKKALGYATQEVSGDEVSVAKEANFINSLSGKISGVNIRKSNEMGGSSNVIIRGYKSLTGNNQPLFVVDGTPISNAVTNTSDQRTGRGGYDFGNAAMDVNPEDIESVNVLKGAAATALYGSRAANGAIIITTKKGAKNKGLGITINSGLQVGTVDMSTLPVFQKEYGAGYGPFYSSDDGYFELADIDGDGVFDDLAVPMGEDASMGARFDENLQVLTWESIYPQLSTFNEKFPYVAGANDPNTFWETALTFNNSVAVSGGTDRATYRLSYTNYNQSGIVPNSNLEKNTIGFSGGYDVSDRLKVTSSVNYVNQNAKGRYGTGYDSRNYNQQFRQWWYVGVDIERQREVYEETGLNLTWNPYGYEAADPTAPHYMDNPYWTAYENFSTDGRDRIFGNVEATFTVTDWLDIVGRASVDNYSELQEGRIAVGSVDVSQYSRYTRNFTESNYDLIARFNRYFGEGQTFSVGGNIGMNLRRSRLEAFYAQTNGGLIIPNVYALSNSVNPIIVSNAQPIVDNNKRLPVSETAWRIGTNGYFAQASFGYNQFLYLDLTGRYDISSTLPADNNSIFYPSASLSLVFSELMDIEVMNYGKLRFNYAEVGNDAPPLSLFDTYELGTPFAGVPLATAPNTQNARDLLPERTRSLEAGLELQFINNRLGLDLSVYKSNTFDQIIPVSVSPSTGSSFRYVNAGNIQNKGVEVALTGSPIRTNDFGWDIRVNWSKNVNEVIELFGDQTNLLLTSPQGGVSINATVGESYGAIKGTDFVYHTDGQVIVYEFPGARTGVRYARTGPDEVIGNMMPDWNGGVQNILRFKAVSLSFLVDFQKGGEFFSLDTYYGYATGVYDITAGLNDKGNPIRDRPEDGGGMNVGGVLAVVDATGQPLLNDDGMPYSEGVANTEYLWMSDFASGIGYATAPNAHHIYDASYVKLREVALTFSLPSPWFENNVFRGIDVSLVGRNLWIIHKNSPYSDPEAGLSAGNIQGYQSGAYPSVREMGVNLRLNF